MANQFDFTDAEFDKQLKASFLEEASELLDATESQLVCLEKPDAAKDAVDRIFRNLHTIKGSAGIAGFSPLSELAHGLESLLDRVRSGVRVLDADVIDGLFKGFDGIKAHVAVLKVNPNATVDGAEWAQVLAALGQTPGTPIAAVTVAEGPAEVATPANQPQTSAIQRRVLVVDDDEDVRGLIAEIIGNMGLTAVTAASGVEGIRAWESAQGQFKLIVCDQVMPQMKGIEMIRHIRSHGGEMPVIMVSGATGRAEALEYIKLGAVAFFEKPFQEEALQTAVRSAIRTYEQRLMVDDLSLLMIRSFMTAKRLSALLEDRVQTAEDGQQLSKFADFLQQIGMIVERLRTPDF